MFMAERSQGRDCHVYTHFSLDWKGIGISALHLLFESQSTSLTTIELGNKTIVKNILIDSYGPHDTCV